jgi:hypothetical protein
MADNPLFDISIMGLSAVASNLFILFLRGKEPLARMFRIELNAEVHQAILAPFSAKAPRGEACCLHAQVNLRVSVYPTGDTETMKEVAKVAAFAIF